MPERGSRAICRSLRELRTPSLTNLLSKVNRSCAVGLQVYKTRTRLSQKLLFLKTAVACSTDRSQAF